MELYYQNVRSIRTKSQNFFINLLSSGYKIICITETWLDENIHSSDYFTPNFIVCRADRDFAKVCKVKGGGSLIAVSDEYISSAIDTTMFIVFPEIDIVGCKLICSSYNLTLIVMYVSPYVSANVLQLFLNLLEENFANNMNVVIVGDFNVPSFYNNIYDIKLKLFKISCPSVN